MSNDIKNIIAHSLWKSWKKFNRHIKIINSFDVVDERWGKLHLIKWERMFGQKHIFAHYHHKKRDSQLSDIGAAHRCWKIIISHARNSLLMIQGKMLMMTMWSQLLKDTKNVQWKKYTRTSFSSLSTTKPLSFRCYPKISHIFSGINVYLRLRHKCRRIIVVAHVYIVF